VNAAKREAIERLLPARREGLIEMHHSGGVRGISWRGLDNLPRKFERP
jgi:hypothetical protein